MRTKLFAHCLPIVACGVILFSSALAQEDPNETDNVRGAFITTRPGGPRANSTSSGANTNRRTTTARNRNNRTPDRRVGAATNTGRRTTGNSTARRTTNAGTSARVENATTDDGASTNSSFAPASIGLGYTIFARDASGAAVRVDPSTQFGAGDAIRLTLESNIDGYLYVFHTENDRNPQMLFPDARLNGGVNLISAHVPYEVPSSLESDERNRWFVFDATPAVERLYVVVTREPLPTVPTAEELVNYCGQSGATCPWRPAPAVWQRVRAAAQAAGVQMSRSREYGQSQTTDEREAATRGAPMTQRAPQPAIVRMNASTETPLLVTMIDLAHR